MRQHVSEDDDARILVLRACVCRGFSIQKAFQRSKDHLKHNVLTMPQSFLRKHLESILGGTAVSSGEDASADKQVMP